MNVINLQVLKYFDSDVLCIFELSEEDERFKKFQFNHDDDSSSSKQYYKSRLYTVEFGQYNSNF
jgi:hypothetical protein